MFFFSRTHLTEFNKRRRSVAALIGANLLPLFGVLLLGWKTFDVVLIYWLENVVLGAINVLRMVVARDCKRGKVGNYAQKLVCIPLFCFHYGFACTAHGAFIVQLLAPNGDLMGGKGRMLTSPSQLAAVVNEELSFWQWTSLAAFAASHLVSFFVNYLGSDERRRWTPYELMFVPYGRVVLLHVAILVGGVISLKLGSPVFVLALLVTGKTLLDLAMHLKEHRSPPERTNPTRDS